MDLHIQDIPCMIKNYDIHSGFFRTFKRIAALVYWEGMRQDILRFMAACETCQQNKYQALSPAGLLQPLPIPTQVGLIYLWIS